MKIEAKEFYNTMIIDRNNIMVDKIEEYINGDKKYFVTAGYLHFMGDDSIIKILKTNGYTVEKI